MDDDACPHRHSYSHGYGHSHSHSHTHGYAVSHGYVVYGSRCYSNTYAYAYLS